jgi:S1-C subfamily serine protease
MTDEPTGIDTGWTDTPDEPGHEPGQRSSSPQPHPGGFAAHGDDHAAGSYPTFGATQPTADPAWDPNAPVWSYDHPVDGSQEAPIGSAFGSGSRNSAGARSVLVVAVIAALIGGLVGGLVVSRKNDQRARPLVFGANTSKIARAGDVQSILARVEPAVVAINTQAVGLDFFLAPTPQQGAGTGFVVDANGIIVTNNHVIAGAQTIKVTFPDGSKSLTARVLGKDPTADLAVLKVDETGLSSVTLGDSDKLQVGDDVIAIGNALALPGGPTVTRGIISAKNRTIQAGGDSGSAVERLEGVLQTDAAINPGNSGGPLVNAAGEVIGINTAVAGEGQNIGFAIAITQARSTIDQLRQGKTPVSPFLGVQTTDLPQSQASQLGVDKGAVVVAVTAGSPAENAGLERGDVIVELDGKPVDSAEAVGRIVKTHKPGDQVTIVVVRGGNRQSLRAKIGARPGSS